MSLQRERFVFSPHGDILLLLQATDDHTSTPETNGSTTGSAATRGATATTGTTSVVGSTPSTGATAALSISSPPNAKGAPGATATTGIREVELQVSSEHLSLASNVFCDMFHGLSLKPISLEEHESVPLRNDNFGAMVLLLNIIHGLTRKVPRKIEWPDLLQVSVLIDKYEFHEVAEVFTDMWFDALRHEIPERLTGDLASWIFICWVLNKQEQYEALTRIAIYEIDYELSDQKQILPYWIHDEIQAARLAALDKLLKSLSEYLDVYSLGVPQCFVPDCDALVLGKFVMGLKLYGLYPFPVAAVVRRSIKALFLAVRMIDLNFGRMHTNQYPEINDNVHLGGRLRNAATYMERSLAGLSIQESQRSTTTVV